MALQRGIATTGGNSTVNSGASARTATSGAARTFSALRHRNFRLFLSGQVVSNVGSWMQNTAQGWLLVLLAIPGASLAQASGGGKSEALASLYLSLVAAANALPMLFGSLYGGIIADRYSRRTIILLTQAAQGLLALAMSALIFTGHIAVWQVIVFALLLGITNVFDVPARQAFVVEMVGKEDLSNAIALNSSLFNAARAFGPGLTGLLLALLAGMPEQTALAICFLINGLSYLGVIVGLLAMRGDFSPENTTHISPLEATREVFAYLRAHDGARLLVCLVAVFSLCAVPYWTLIPSLAKFSLNANAREFGFLLSAQGIGALVGALFLASRSEKERKGVTMTRAYILFPVFLLLLAFSRNYWLSAGMIMCSGFFAITFIASANATLQTSVPDALRGRLMGLYSLILMGLTPVGSLWSGGVAQAWGAPAALATGAFVLLLTGIGVAFRFPTFRQMERTLPERL